MQNANINQQLVIAQSSNQNQRNNRPAILRRLGSVRLSNKSSVNQARRVRTQLVSKQMEIANSTLDPAKKQALSSKIQLSIDKVDRMITQIRRRERAETEQKREEATKRTEENQEKREEIQREVARRRRRNDTREQSVRVRRDFLYRAEDGGFDPYGFRVGGRPQNTSPMIAPAASFDINGKIGSMDIDVSVDVGAVDLVL